MITNQSQKPAIIFDFGGVFMRTLDYTPRHRWDDRLTLPHGRVEQVVHGSESWKQAQTGSLSINDYWDDVAKQLQLSQSEIQQLAHDFFSGDVLDQELVGYTRELKAAGYPIALLSNDSPALLEKLHHLQIADLFQPLVISAFIGVMKPDPLAYQTVLTQLGYHAKNAIFIDDMPANIAGAEAVGIHAIRYVSFAPFKDELTTLLATFDTP